MYIVREINVSHLSSSNRITLRILGKTSEKFNMVPLNDRDLLFLLTAFRISWPVSADRPGTF